MILLVDGNEADRRAVRELLGRTALAASVLEAGTAREAEALVAQCPFECVLLERRLPDADGLALLPGLRQGRFPAPVVMLTGSGDERLATEAMKAGAADSLSKASLTSETLEHALRHARRVFEAEQEAERTRRELSRYAHQLQALAAAVPNVSARLEPERVLLGFCKRARELFEARAAGICVLHPKREGAVLRVRAEEKVSEIDVVEDPAPLAACLREEVPMASLSAAELTGTKEWRELVSCYGLLLPQTETLVASIPGSDGAVGLVLLHDLPRPAGTHDRRVLGQLTQLVSVALENVRLVRDARRAARVRDEVMGVVSHDLRGPLQVIQVSADVLSRLSPTDRQVDLLDKIRRAVRSANRLIEDLLDVSRLDSGKLALTVAREPVQPLLEEALEGIRPLAAKKEIALVLDCSPDLPEPTVDRTRILQALANLLGNALKYTPPGGRISILARVADGELVISVRDTGRGIAAEHLGHVFERFWQGSQERREGAGLGLFIVAGMIAAHHGRVWVESELGKGSTFSFALPLPVPTALAEAVG